MATPLAAQDMAQIGQGQQVYQHWCAPCHANSTHAPGTVALYFKYQGDVIPVLEARDDMDEDMLRHFIREGVSVMPSFRKTEISDADITAIAAYLQASSAAFKAQQAAK
jgi:mono/diheme cytochrome c family protein